MVYWFNCFDWFPFGENQALFRIVGTKATEYGVGGGYPPAHIYIYIHTVIPKNAKYLCREYSCTPYSSFLV